MEQEIKREFERNGFTLDDDDDDDILERCLTFCINYKLSPSDLVSSWDVYSLNRGLELKVQSVHMDAFLVHLQNEQKDAMIKKEPGLHLYYNDVSMELSDEHEDIKEDSFGTPSNRSETQYPDPFDSTQKAKGNVFASGKLSESVTPFGQRKSKFVVQSTLNDLPDTGCIKEEPDPDNLSNDIIKRIQPSLRCSLQIHGSPLEPGCKCMHDRIEDKFDFLENRIKKFASALVASGIYEEPTDPTVASQKSILAVGMICCEEEGRLKEKPILLQSSVEHSGGQRVRLELQKLSQFSIFPGQVIAVEGHNPSGHCLVASNIIDCSPLSVSANENLHPAKKQAISADYQPHDLHQKQSEIFLITASGPFTTTDNLAFEPLTELLAYAKRKQPQLLILLGPFVDSDRPDIKKGTVNRTFDEIFHLEILGRLRDYVEYMGPTAQVILVPSVRDANHDFVFPQPAFDIQPPELKHQITSLSNPGIFSVNEVNVGCCTVDILKQLSGEEISRNLAGGSKQRMSTLANHILNQRSFYPLYPPEESTPLDFSLDPEALGLPFIPDILILPSDLAHFVRVLSPGQGSGEEEKAKCICINPGRLARGEGGGFFVELHYHGCPESASASVIRI